MTTPMQSTFEKTTVAELKDMLSFNGKFEGHKVHLFVEGYVGPNHEEKLTGGVVVAIGSQFVLKFRDITMNLPARKDWNTTFEEFNNSTNMFTVIGYEEA